MKTVMAHRCVMIGSDASAMAVDGLLAKGHPHPRTFGTFPRVLGKYVREEKVLQLEEAVYKMTGMPAARLSFGIEVLYARATKPTWYVLIRQDY